MEKVFMCSLCMGGILGGALYFESDTLTYKTNKLTVDKKYRNLAMPLKDIKDVTWKWAVFPIATFSMANGEKYKIMIYNKNRFVKCYNEYNFNLMG